MIVIVCKQMAMISIEEAISLMEKYVKNSNLKKHMIAVSIIMRHLAEELGEDPELWEIVGLLHDIDFEEVGEDFKSHGTKSAEILAGLLREEALHAIMAHNERTGVKAETVLDQALIAADSISGLAIATALIMPNKSLGEVKVRSLKKKFRDKSFARNVDRDRIMYCERIGLNYDVFLAISLKALQSIGERLGL